jgi:signal transduction histidine kinase
MASARRARPGAAGNPADIASASTRLIWTRWAAGALVVAGAVFATRVLRLPLPERTLVIIGLLIFAYNGALVLTARRFAPPQSADYLARIQRFVILQVMLDWLSMIAFVHLTGGITSPAIPFFGIHMLMVAILLPAPTPYYYVGLAGAALGLVALLERAGTLPHYNILPALPEALYRDPLYILAVILFFLAAFAATVILTADVMERLRERERQVAALLQTTQTISSTLSLPEVLQRLAASAARALEKRRASIRLLDESGAVLAMAGAYGLSEDYKNKGPVQLRRSAIDTEAIAGKVVYVRDAPSDTRIQYPDHIRSEGIGSMIVAPILGRERPLGVLRVYSSRPDGFTRDAGAFVQAIARQGAVAIENALAHETLQREEQLRAQFVRTVTHELRAPVGGAQSLLRVLLKTAEASLTATQRDILARVEVRLDSLQTLINDLLALAASKTSEFQQAPAPIPLLPLVKRIFDQVALEATDKQIAMTLEAPEADARVRGTEDGLSNIFGNLMGNAVKYTPAGGKVTVHIALTGGQVVTSVSDTGIGIPEKDLPQLWQEFFRASNARASKIVGTGLGLSIVKRLVETFGGHIQVHSVEGQGTTFTVTLPQVEAPSA